MKIGVDVRVLMDKYYSGVSEYTANLLNTISKLDKSNDYKLFYNSFTDQRERLEVFEKDNFKLVGLNIPNKIFNYLFQKTLSYPKIDKFIGGVDVFYSPHFNFTKLSKEVKKVITVHDLSFLRYPHFFNHRKNFWHRTLEIKKTLIAADKIIAVSENTKNDIVELLEINGDKIQVIYSGNNAVKKEVSEENIKDFLHKRKLSGRIILYLGTIEPRKNIIGLIKAYNKLRSENISLTDVKLVLAGASGWKNRLTYREWQLSPYKNDIRFLGYVNKDEKDVLYSCASLFVYPSYYEGFGFPPLEAMTYGLPVVCSNVSSLPEVVGDAALMINPFSTNEIAEVLKLIIEDSELRELYIKKGYERAALFSWEKTAGEYLEVFRNA
ncbi:MAG: glycosyltransferase family 4 protein [Patescibacteria group bacterium]